MGRQKRLTTAAYISGIKSGDRLVLSRAITLVESSLPADIRQAEEVLQAVLPLSGRSVRIGITGVPGVGKSTFIEAFGSYLTSLGKRLCVLTVDPSSQRTGGSILGDKTRMNALSKDPNAYIRPSASGSALGGVSHKTREAIFLCEAAGFDVVLIETVGVGQSETLVHGMVDFFLLLMLAGAGDELQGIKKGIMEMADAILINKADGDNKLPAKKAKAAYQSALHLFAPPVSGWIPEVKTCSSLEQEGIEEIWEMIGRHHHRLSTSGFFEQNRKAQNRYWMETHIANLLKHEFYRSEKVRKLIPVITAKVENGELPALNAAYRLIGEFRNP